MSFRSRWQLWSALRPGGGRPQWPRNSFRSSRRWQHWQGGGGGEEGGKQPRGRGRQHPVQMSTRVLMARERGEWVAARRQPARARTPACARHAGPGLRARCAAGRQCPCSRIAPFGAARRDMRAEEPAERRQGGVPATVTKRRSRAGQRAHCSAAASRDVGWGPREWCISHICHMRDRRSPRGVGAPGGAGSSKQLRRHSGAGRQAGVTRPQPRATLSLTLSRTHCTRGCSSGVAPRLANAVHSLCTSRPPSSRTDRRNPFLSYGSKNNRE